MYIPEIVSISPQIPGPFTIDFSSQDDGSSKNWSSIVGIVTAICGNVLISFALNTQRYAHLRLSRDRGEDEEKEQQTARQTAAGGNKSYGTQQAEIAEQRARENAQAGASGDVLEDVQEEDEEHAERSETDPLIPSINIRKSSSSTVSTYRPSQEKKEATSSKTKSYLSSPIWWLGISLMTIGEAGNFLAYGFAPASIVSPLGVVALISNCLIAPLMLHEEFRWRDAMGVVIAVGGCVTVVLSASDSNPKLDPNDIWGLVSQWEFETYVGITVFLIIALAVLSNKYGEKTVLIDVGLVGLFGGYTALSTKGVASLLSNTIWRVVTFPITYILVAVLVFTAIMQIKYINRALQRFSSTIVIPVQFVLFTISVIVGSAILYRDFERRSSEDAIKFFGGCALTFLGVWCITSGRGDNTDDDDSAIGQDEEPVVLIDHEGVQPEIREREDDAERKHSLVEDLTAAKPAPLRRLHTADEMQQPIIIPSTPPQQTFGGPETPFQLENQPWPLAAGPANRAAVHIASMAQLPSDSQKRQQPPPMHATTSAPTVPTLDPSHSSLSRPYTPLTRQISGPATPQTPRTPTRQISTDGHGQAEPGSHRLLNRPSMVGLLPGPLTSPLSSSLSAIVADSLRRGVDSPYPAVRRKSMRSRQAPSLTPTATPQPQSRGGGRENYFDAGAKRHSISSGVDVGFDHAPTPLDGPSSSTSAGLNPRAGSSSKGGRARSLSATLEEFFQPSQKRQRVHNNREEEEVEEGGEER